MNRRVITRVIIMGAALLIAALALPLSLQEAARHHIRSSTFSAVRFAAQQDPAQLAQLPVRQWREEEGVRAPSVHHTGWERYTIDIPRATTTVVAELDLRPVMSTLLVGAGGWLRVIATLFASASLLYWGLNWERRRRNSATSPSRPTPLSPNTAAPSGVSPLLQTTLDLMTPPGLVLDAHHQLVQWNIAAANDSPKLSWTPGLHLLDIAAQLSWGEKLIEAVDAHLLHHAASAPRTMLIIKEGEQICVTAG